CARQGYSYGYPFDSW
nr:immunoglobulin heavy chain junction region [Macaca mulatta]